MFESLEGRRLLAGTPFHGAPFDVDTVIQAEDFNLGGEGVAYHDTTPANEFFGYRAEGPDIESTGDGGGGYNVGFVKAGEFLDYTVNVPTTGTYDVAFRLANIRGGGTFHLADADSGVNLSGAIAVPNTGNWQGYATVTRSVNLTAGTHVLRIQFDGNASSGYVGNFNWWSIISGGQGAFPGPAPTPLNPGTTIEAENFDRGGQRVAYNDTDAANVGGANHRPGEGVDVQTTTDAGGGFNVGFVRAGEFLEYTVSVASAGTYELAFRVANQRSGGSFHLDVDGTNATGAIAVPNTGDWQGYTTVTRSVTLTGGVHVLRLAMDANSSNGFVGNFNWIRVNSAPTQTPFPGPNPFVVAPGNRLELEHFDNGGEGVAYHDTEPQNLVPFFRETEGVEHAPSGDVGGTFNVDLVKAGEWLEYTVDVPTAGNFNLGFRVANIRGGGSFHLDVDGANATGPVAVPNTGGWHAWQTVTRQVSLTAGQHVLRLAFDANSSAGYVGNFNWMSVSAVS